MSGAGNIHENARATNASASPLLKVSHLGVRYRYAAGLFRGAQQVCALDGTSFDLPAGQALGVVGESGCGKSTLARAILRLVTPSEGEVAWRGHGIRNMNDRELRAMRRELQPVFQDPRASLDPRMTVEQVVSEPLSVHRSGLGMHEREASVCRVLEQVGLPDAILYRYPHQLSGGQCQRVAIARALVVEPAMLVCDEPVSALDVSVQAQVVNLLRRLQGELRLSMLFVSHNLAVIRYVSERVLVLYLGRTMELAPRDQIYTEPLHPYTRALLEAIPDLEQRGKQRRKQWSLGGELPSPIAPPSGCVYRTRCPLAIARCAEQRPALEHAGGGRWVACHRWQDVGAMPQQRNG